MENLYFQKLILIILELKIQMKDRVKREYEEELRNKEYARIWKEHFYP